MNAAAALEALHRVIDPEVGVNIVDLGLVYDLTVDADAVRVTMTMTTPACPLGPYLANAVESCLWQFPEVEGVDVQIVWDPPWDAHTMMTDAAKRQLGWIE